MVLLLAHAFATEHQDLDPVEEEQEEPDAESYYDVQDAVEPDGQPQQDEPAEEHDVDGEAESEGVGLQSVAEVLTVCHSQETSVDHFGEKVLWQSVNSGPETHQPLQRLWKCRALGRRCRMYCFIKRCWERTFKGWKIPA